MKGCLVRTERCKGLKITSVMLPCASPLRFLVWFAAVAMFMLSHITQNPSPTSALMAFFFYRAQFLCFVRLRYPTHLCLLYVYMHTHWTVSLCHSPI